MLKQTTKKSLEYLGLLKCEDSFQLEHLFQSLSDSVINKLSIVRKDNKYKCLYSFRSNEERRTISQEKNIHEAIAKAIIALKNLDII